MIEEYLEDEEDYLPTVSEEEFLGRMPTTRRPAAKRGGPGPAPSSGAGPPDLIVETAEMAELTAALVKQLRDRTSAGMMDCKTALQDSDGDLDKALHLLRERGIAKAGKRAGRATGRASSRPTCTAPATDFPPQVGVLVEVNCETDFVAKGDDLRKLAQRAGDAHRGGRTRAGSRQEDVPDRVLEQERELYRRKAEQDGGPSGLGPDRRQSGAEVLQGQRAPGAGILPRAQDQIRDLIAQTVATVQENITVRRFSRFNIREG